MRTLVAADGAGQNFVVSSIVEQPASQLNLCAISIEENMDRHVFAVADDAYCCWEHDLAERNNRFLSAIDAAYFDYVAQLHMNQLEGEDEQRSAIALRLSYHHGLETLFSFLGALVQAPDNVPAWISKCSTINLRKVVRLLAAGGSLLTQVGPQRLTLDDLSAFVHSHCWPDENPANATGTRFATLWHRFADDFLNEHHIAEYNSLKHGFRVNAGGFTLRVGMEEVPGIQAPEANMRVVGGSRFGTRFFESQSVLSDPVTRHHFRIRQLKLNWRAEAMVQRLQLIAWSINNIVGCLRCVNGAPPETVQFHRPEDPTIFEEAWTWPVGIFSSNFDLEIAPTEVEAASRQQLLDELASRTSS